jgi:hypothetical protein
VAGIAALAGGGLSGLRQLGADQRVVRRDLAGHQGRLGALAFLVNAF